MPTTTAPRSPSRLPQHTRTAIEQGIARGETLTQICVELDVPFVTVEGVYRHMNLVAEPPEIQPHGTHAGYVRHCAAHDRPCIPCRDAERLYQAQAHQRRKAWAAA